MMTILVAGPYRSGTGGVAALIERNLHRLEQAALAIYRRGHVPMIGEWLALPLAKAAGSARLGDAISEEFLYRQRAASVEMMQCCEWRRNKGADDDVRVGQRLAANFRYADVPAADAVEPGQPATSQTG
jgi:hypothetical protein